ncbi:hypothetical protein ACTJJ4_11790 [Microbacterium sp. 22195]|uniref:hypothetical protein n=1 Tax=Microbacterium sp. 22195 TaxID=3453891 RepID=UPI003F85B2B5
MTQFSIRPQRNPTNPILLAFRGREDPHNIYAIRQWINFIIFGWDGTICPASQEHQQHAARVLMRLQYQSTVRDATDKEN